MTNRVTTALVMGVREFRRTLVLLGLLVFLPVYWIGVFMYNAPDRTIPLTVDGESASVAISELAGVLLTPTTAALLAGIVGLFLMHSSKEADDRLRLAGYRSHELIISRVGLLAVSGSVAGAVCLGVVLTGFTPESLAVFVAATFLVTLTYGVLGVIVGIALDKLPGIYVLLFTPLVDVAILQSPLASDAPTWVKLLPGHFGTKAIMDAAFTSSVEMTNLYAGVAYLFVLLVVGTVVLYRATATN